MFTQEKLIIRKINFWQALQSVLERRFYCKQIAYVNHFLRPYSFQNECQFYLYSSLSYYKGKSAHPRYRNNDVLKIHRKSIFIFDCDCFWLKYMWTSWNCLREQTFKWSNGPISYFNKDMAIERASETEKYGHKKSGGEGTRFCDKKNRRANAELNNAIIVCHQINRWIYVWIFATYFIFCYKRIGSIFLSFAKAQ